MSPQPPYQHPPHQPPTPHVSPQYTGHVPYQSPGAHQKSQWITDEGTIGKILVVGLILLSILGVIGGGIIAVLWFLLGW